MNTNKNDIEELVLSLQSSEVALWLGQKWKSPDTNEKQILLANQDWYGIWSDCESPSTATVIKKHRPSCLKNKHFVEVPDGVVDVIQVDFKYSTYCPFFYLNGNLPHTDKMKSSKRMLSRLQKLAHLERLGPATLLLCGLEAGDVVDFLNRNVDFLGRLESIFVTEIDETLDSKLENEEVPPILLSKLKWLYESLSEILDINTGKVQSDVYDLKTHIKARRGNEEASVLILDLRMPGMDGFALQKRLNEPESRMEIVFITADAQPGDREQGLRAGAIAFLQKPFQEQILFEAIDSAPSRFTDVNHKKKYKEQ